LKKQREAARIKRQEQIANYVARDTALFGPQVHSSTSGGEEGGLEQVHPPPPSSSLSHYGGQQQPPPPPQHTPRSPSVDFLVRESTDGASLLSNGSGARKERALRAMNEMVQQAPAGMHRRPIFKPDLLFLDAVRQGDIAEASQLLALGADINTATFERLTALHYAAANNDMIMIEFLATKGADLDAKDLDQWTPLHTAAHWGNMKGTRFSMIGSSHVASALQSLVDKGANMLAVNSDNDIPFDVADDPDVQKLLQGT